MRTAERDAGARLVEPHGRGLRLTGAGELLADGADDVARPSRSPSTTGTSRSTTTRRRSPCGTAITPRLPIRDNRLIAALVAAAEGIALLPRFTTTAGDGLSLRPLVDVPSARWIVGLSRPDRAERAAVRLVTRTLSDVGAGVGV